MKNILAPLLVVLVSGCGPSSASRISESIETYCTAQVVSLPMAAPRAPGSVCRVNGDCDGDVCVTQGSLSFCSSRCAASAECPTALPACVDLGGVSVCLPACSLSGPIADCVIGLEREHDVAISTRCTVELEAWIECRATNAPFCTASDEDAACGVEDGHYRACVMAN